MSGRPEKRANDAELLELAREPRIEQTDEALATMLGVPVEMVAPAGGRDTAPEQPTPEQPGPPPSHRCPEHGDLCRGPACCCADLHEPEQPIGGRDSKPANVARTAADIRHEIYGQPPYSGPGLKHGPGGTGRTGPCDADCRKCELEAEIADLQEVQDPGFDRLQASLVMPAHLLAVASPAISAHARLCCARLGAVWCTEPDGHPPPCKGPEEREIQGSDFGPRRRR